MNADVSAGPARGLWGRIGRRVTKAAEIASYALLRAAGRILRFKPRHRAKDRRLLDEVILPGLARNDRYRRVLFVGCDWYTEHVEGLFAAHGREYATLEVDRDRARHGARRHVVGELADLGDHFQEGSLDLIICNGVIGWGLDNPEEIEKSIAACARALASEGLLLLGWDDVPEKLPVPIEAIRALAQFRPAIPAGFDQPVIRAGTYTNHTFGFFAKPLPRT